MKCAKQLAVGVCLFIFASTVAAGFRTNEHDKESESDDDVVAFSSIPKAAQRTLLKEAGKAKIESVARETDDGFVEYEGLWRVAGVEHEACVSADGQLLERETAVNERNVPAAVRKAAAAKFGNAKVKYERKMVVVYEAEIEVGGKEQALLLSPVGRQIEDEDDDDDDDK